MTNEGSLGKVYQATQLALIGLSVLESMQRALRSDPQANAVEINLDGRTFYLQEDED
ncbi:MAG TPA: hypothetical protein VGP82_19865 [Ktedonobacterales bacterium]|nr:hypothetical protein [Ktedonobacterales bacterium]